MVARPQLKSAMTPFPHSVDVDDSVGHAWAVMEKHGVRHLPVTDNHELVGVVSDRDLMRLRSDAPEETRRDARIREVFVADAYLVDLNEPLDNVLLTMAERHTGSALVTRKGRLAGVFTSTDACRCFGEFLREVFPHGGDDSAA